MGSEGEKCWGVDGVVEPHIDDRAIVPVPKTGDAGDGVTERVSLPLEDGPVGCVVAAW